MATPIVNTSYSKSDSTGMARTSIYIEAQKTSAYKPRRKTARVEPALTGCVSKLSVVELRGETYFEALSDYADCCAREQAHLAVTDWEIPHDYALIRNLLVEPDRIVPAEEDEPVAASVQVSDDDIDYCGYMGWLR